MTILKEKAILVSPSVSGRTTVGENYPLYTFYSYDRKSAQLVFDFKDNDGNDIDITNATPKNVLTVIEDGVDKQILGTEIVKSNEYKNRAVFVIPESILGYEGIVTLVMGLEFEDGSTSDTVKVKFKIDKSPIDKAYEAAGDYYVAEFEVILQSLQNKADTVTEQLDGIQETMNEVVTGLKPDGYVKPISFQKTLYTNLFNQETTTDGAFIDNSNNIISNENFAYSDYIAVKPNTDYSIPITFSAPGGYYTSDKTYIHAIENNDISNNNNKTFTTPANAAYVRLNCKPVTSDMNKGSKNFFSLTEGTTALSLPIGYGVSQQYQKSYSKNLMGKKMVTFGDSITWYDNQSYVANSVVPNKRCIGYQSYMRTAFDCEVNNQGVSGEHSAQIRNRSVAFNYTGYELATYFCGVNDFGTTRAVGEVKPVGSDFDRYTLIGAYQSMLEDVMKRYPAMKLAIIIPYKVWNTDVGGAMPVTYAKGIKDVAEFYSIPVLDLYNESQINEVNRASLFVDDQSKVPYYYHLNNTGYELISRKIVSFINGIMG